jgi:type IV pilus assembly protein PilY1
MGLLGARIASGDDTDILGLGAVAIEPNVMIIFDTSDSMDTRDIPADPYNGGIDYTDGGGGYEKNAVYRWKTEMTGGYWSRLVQWNWLDQTCKDSGIDDELNGNGQAWGRINTDSPYDCDGDYDEIDLRMGNFLNYESGGYKGPMRTRLDAGKEAVKTLIDRHPDVRFGLMRTDPGKYQLTGDAQGGALTKNGDINQKPTTAQLKADVDAFTAKGHSPLAWTLDEAGRYFAGQQSRFNNVTYTSPIDIKCRPNAVILITDGESTRDRDEGEGLGQQNGNINNGTIGDGDEEGNVFGEYLKEGSDYLDDVAAFLFENDLMPEMGTGHGQYEKQNIITHTVGFKSSHQLLRDTAKNGGGRYFTAGSTDALSKAIEKIVGIIDSGGLVFGAASIPASSANGVYAGNHLYLGLFKPDPASGRWQGNLKKYALNANGGVVDKNNLGATDSQGRFLTTAQSFWSEVADGAQVDQGGAGALLVKNSDRNLYTYTGGSDKRLTAEINAFTISNKDNIALADLGVENDDERQAVIKNILGVGKNWVMADVIHSKPAVVRYDTNGDEKMDGDDDAIVYVGTNGAVMHAFQDSTGEELWGFIPPQQLGRLKRLGDGSNAHDYFIDGPPVPISYTDDGVPVKVLIFGERRGGSNYYALDISAYDNPIFKYTINDSVLGENAERLGQSWGRPQFASIATSADTTAQVLLIPGGYDIHQDAETPLACDTKGRAVFSVVADSGMPGTFKFYNEGESSDMTYSIVDVAGVDLDGDGITESIYAPDLGGNMFAFTDRKLTGVWKKFKLFNASSGDAQRKIFFSPDVIRIIGDPDPADNIEEQKVGEMIFFGTGDRAHPQNTKVKNRFYAVKNYWWEKGFKTLTDRIDLNGGGDLHDATRNQILQAATWQAQKKALAEITDRLGWFIELESAGEKVVSSPLVYNKVVYFTTYVPAALEGAADDLCDVTHNDVTGEARLYALDYTDARAVHDHWSDAIEYNPVTGKEITSGGKADRYIKIGKGIPTAPTIAIRDGFSMLYVAVGDRLFQMAPKDGVEFNMYYWREVRP